MTLAAGTRLGSYEILAPLGAGGMGEVWRARDSRLGREVAVKSLPASFAQDPERLARFEREARLLAALQHARIATIHGLEESGGHRYLVMELVAGESLADRLASGPVPVREALEIARQIAEGLEAAHEKGIVHRDLKPSNIHVGPDGSVKILDFGLAKAFDADASGSGDVSRSPTISAQMTGTGIILGTAAYMSPEQARGRPVDRRTDIWAFGVVLYEMLTGRRLFTGETVSDTLAAVLRADPDWSRLPAETPSIARRLLARCLERDPKQRLHDIGDARLEVEEALAELKSGPRSDLAAAAVRPSGAFPRLGFLLVALALAAAAFFAGRLLSPEPRSKASSGPPIHSVVNLPKDTFLAGWASPVLAISRDGRKLAYVASHSEEGMIGNNVATNELYVHHLDRGETQLVPGSETAEGPIFSPDGQWIAFAVDVSLATGRPGQLKKFSLATGLTQPVAPIPDYAGGDWGPDGNILVAPNWTSGPWRISGDGGEPDRALERVRLDGKEVGRALFWPQVLPGGRSALTIDGGTSSGQAAVLDLADRTLRPTGVKTAFARYLESGHLLALQADASVFAVPFDPQAARPLGSGVAVLKDVALGANGAPALAVSENGSLVYATGYLRASGRELLTLSRLSMTGQIQPLPFEPDTFTRAPRPSPDGRRIALTTWDGNVWIYDVARATRERLPRGPTSEAEFPVWSPDGARVTFSTFVEGVTGISLVWQKSDGSAPPEILIGGGPEKAAMAFSPDGRFLIYRQFGTPHALWLLDVKEKGAPRRLMEGAVIRSAQLSRDGRWLIYDSSESGRYEVYARRFPELDRKIQVSAGGGGVPHWSHDGRAIYYFLGDQIVRVQVTAGETLEVSRPETLFEAKGMRSFAVAPDGNGFYATMRAPESGMVRQLHLVTNWFSELERLAPAGKTP